MCKCQHPCSLPLEVMLVGWKASGNTNSTWKEAGRNGLGNLQFRKWFRDALARGF